MKFTIPALSLAVFLLIGTAWAEHPGLVTTHRDAIQKAMANHIDKVTEQNENGMFPVFDPETKTLVQLKFKAFHDSVEIKGKKTPYLVSCADFTTQDGTLYDLDFLVSGKYGVVAILVHAKNGKHITYEIP